jgi:N-acyl homoserine lactone hydrolase
MAEGKAKRMWALPGAVFVVPESSLMVGGSSEIIEVPVPSFLIEHPKGLVLYDTGSHPRVAEDVASYWGEMFRNMVRFSKDLTVDNQIKALGYKVSDVKYVVMSHLHMDHTGGLFMFPHARLLTMKGELNYAYWPAPDRRNIFLIDDFLPTRNYQWMELEGEFDMFGDGSLTMLHTPGHTPGSTSLVVRLPHQNIVLAGDAVHMRDALDTEHTMMVDTDPAQSVRSIQRLRAMRDMQGMRIWVSHDPKDWAEMGPAPKVID